MTAAEVEVAAPDIEPFRAGNTGIPFVTTLDAGRAGPHVLITALTHGNELSGAYALCHLLETGIRPRRGRLTLAFVNHEAFRRFDPDNPRASRYLDEDLNRVWSSAVLDGPRRSRELDRAREIRPLVESADHLLDLHSMQLPSQPLALAGLLPKGRRLARHMRYPLWVVADAGHRNGVRMRDYGRFADPDDPASAVLVECGQHWAARSIDVAVTSCRQFLAALGVLDPLDLGRIGAAPPVIAQQEVEVTEAVTVRDGPFRFVEPFQGLETIPRGGTLIAHDGERPIRTPYDDCVLIMPSQRLTVGLTAVRLGRRVA